MRHWHSIFDSENRLNRWSLVMLHGCEIKESDFALNWTICFSLCPNSWNVTFCKFKTYSFKNDQKKVLKETFLEFLVFSTTEKKNTYWITWTGYTLKSVLVCLFLVNAFWTKKWIDWQTTCQTGHQVVTVDSSSITQLQKFLEKL